MTTSNEKCFAIKGDIIYCENRHKLLTMVDGFVVIRNGLVASVQSDQPSNMNIVDRSDKLIMPAFTDLHTHSGQIQNIGVGYDNTLLDWLNEITFPEEKRFEDPEYAKVQIARFVKELWKNGIMHSVVMPTIHEQATKILLDYLHKSELYCHVGNQNAI